jgi:hypothetical protein
VPAKAVYLISPGYRRWITPDFTEIVFETEGFDSKDGKNWQARLIVADLDGGAEATSTFPIDLSRKTFTLPVPKFHRRAEIILFLENPRDREPVCEGRWNLTNIPKEELAGLSYFDSRGVFFHEGVGRFPLIADANAARSSTWKAFLSAGFTALAINAELVDDTSAALAASLNLLLFPRLRSDSVEATVKDVRRLQRYSSIAGYIASGISPSALRSVDFSRPTIDNYHAHSEGRESAASPEFQDVIMLWQANLRANASPVPSCRRAGRTHFARAHSRIDELHSAICCSAARGAVGVLIQTQRNQFENDKSTKAVGFVDVNPEEFAASLKAAAPVVNAVVRGVPEPSDDSTEDRWFWRRRLPNGERAVIEVKRGDPPTATFKIERDEK